MANRKLPTTSEAIIAPPIERWIRGEIEPPGQMIADEDGRPASPFRAIGTLHRMCAKGIITREMQGAGESFHADFYVGGLERLRAADMGRIPGTHSRGGLSENQVDARERVHGAICALGGLMSPAGGCAWHVLGGDETLEEWAIRERWGGRPINRHVATGILIGALSVLQLHYDNNSGPR